MDVTHETDDEQSRLWNGPSGRAWVDAQELLDQIYKPFEELLVAAVTARPRERVLDVGCGTGSTTLAAARALGSKGRCIGIDISDPMIATARERAKKDNTPVDFICADAQVHAFEPASVDMFVSRFGVMFFADPIQAFANLRRAARDNADMSFIAWRSAAENPFMTTAERAAASLLPDLPPRRPDAPGQFAFANQQRVHTIVEQSGWTTIDIRAIDVECAMPEKELVRHVTRLGPVGMRLQHADDETRARVIDAVRPAFDPYVRGADVRFTAACWMINACPG